MGILDFVSLTPTNNIGGIDVMVTVEEEHTDSLEITQHPVEQGAAITDHAYLKPRELVITAGWSNSSSEAVRGAIEAADFDGQMTTADYVSSIYSQLLSLQESLSLFNVTTSKRIYSNMLMVSLAVRNDPETAQALMVKATFREIITVATQATTLPAVANQADPGDTADLSNGPVAFPYPSAPAPGGSLPFNEWVPDGPASVSQHLPPTPNIFNPSTIQNQ